MATVLIAAGQAGKFGQGSSSPVMRFPPRAVQAITSSASNAVSTVKLNAGEVAMISVNGGAVQIASAAGADPDAATTPHVIIADGSMFPFEAIADDTRIAVADA